MPWVHTRASSAWLAALWLTALCGPIRGQALDYLLEVKPIFTRHCVPCHGAHQPKAGLRLDTAAALRHGGNSKVTWLADSSEANPLLQVLSGQHAQIERMPYRKPALAPGEVSKIHEWILAGAPAPADEVPGVHVHWAFVRPERPEPPNVPGKILANPIDRFVQARLAAEHLEPSPEADRSTLLRRLHLDLTGLPPTPNEIGVRSRPASRRV